MENTIVYQLLIVTHSGSSDNSVFGMTGFVANFEWVDNFETEERAIQEIAKLRKKGFTDTFTIQKTYVGV